MTSRLKILEYGESSPQGTWIYKANSSGMALMQEGGNLRDTYRVPGYLIPLWTLLGQRTSSGPFSLG